MAQQSLSISVRRTLTYWLGLLAAVAAVLWLSAGPSSGAVPAPVLTQHNDNQRSGLNLNEATLNPSNVNAAQFGKLFARAVDGQIYAQPLVVPGLSMPGGTHDVVFVATMHDSVYAFDAGDPAASTPLWQVSLGASAPITYTIPNSTTVGRDFGPPGYHDIAVEVGVVSTPVIDPATNTIYVLAFTKEPNPAACPCQYAHRLHALDLTTGVEKFGGPVVISGSVPGHGEDGDNDAEHVTFQSKHQLQRAGLLLQDGVVYFAFASYGDQEPYHGWVFGYNAATLQPASVWNSTPNAGLGGIWQSGQGLAADNSGKIYLIAGNGDFDPQAGDYGDSFVKLDPQGVVSGVLPVLDSFTPFDQLYLSQHDSDIGMFGPVLITGTNLLLGGGKNGKLYLLNKDDMGGYQQGPGGTDRIVQSVQANLIGTFPLFGAPIIWYSPTGPQLYIWTAGEGIKDYSLAIHSAISATIPITPVATGNTQLASDLFGGYLSLSANGSTAGSGIVWALHPLRVGSTRQGVLRAYDAEDVSHELWNSTQDPARDGIGEWAKFNVPTVANGRVYVASFSNQLDVYGIMGAPWVITQPLSQTVNSGQSAALNVVVSGQGPLTYQWYRGASGDTQNPVGTNSATFMTPPQALATSYWVRASNGLGHADSAPAHVAMLIRVYLLPTIGR